ncbi:MAG: hypothetical protein ABH846_00700 [Patescibacteria group bacterium]
MSTHSFHVNPVRLSFPAFITVYLEHAVTHSISERDEMAVIWGITAMINGCDLKREFEQREIHDTELCDTLNLLAFVKRIIVSLNVLHDKMRIDRSKSQIKVCIDRLVKDYHPDKFKHLPRIEQYPDVLDFEIRDTNSA